MNWKAFIAGVGAGAAAGHLVYHYLLSDKTISGDVILENVKNAFKQEGPIEGSWIQLKSNTIKNSPLIHSYTTVVSLAFVRARKNNSNLSQTLTQEQSLMCI